MKRLLILPLLAAMAVTGCSSATWSRNTPGRIMSNYKLTLYSGGLAVKTWNTKGQVESESRSDGYYFVDIATGKIVEVAGTIVIEQLP